MLSVIEPEFTTDIVNFDNKIDCVSVAANPTFNQFYFDIYSFHNTT